MHPNIHIMVLNIQQAKLRQQILVVDDVYAFI
jgi:hypothetical protein